MNKKLFFKANDNRPKITYEDVRKKMESWEAKQTSGRWTAEKYKDDPGTLPLKNAHQRCYLLDLVRDLNEHNASCPEDEMWFVHSWYKRFIYSEEGYYSITVARLCLSDTKKTRTYLGNTMLSRLHYRKDTVLAEVRKLILEVLLKHLSLGVADFIDHVKDILKLLAGKEEEMKEEERYIMKKIKYAVELAGIGIHPFLYLIRHLVTWMKRLDRKIKLYDGLEFHNWMEYFLKSRCDVKDFCHIYRSHAPNGLYGMFRRPLTNKLRPQPRYYLPNATQNAMLLASSIRKGQIS